MPADGKVHFTVYYYPVHFAKKRPDAVYRYPIYRMPKNSHFTRAEISSGILRGKGLELGYFDNPVDPYILEVQGSGALIFVDEPTSRVRQVVNYAGGNGYSYTSLGRLMREAGVPEEYINLQGIRKYFLEVRPDLWDQFSNKNQSYVYFQYADVGPYGSNGGVLTPYHSVAIDRSYFPMGALGLIQTERPDQIAAGQALSWKPFSQLIIAQDTGGAIKSPGRVDLYYGEGEYAEVAAGRTDRTGKLYFMMVKSAKRKRLKTAH
jgi:membrane-bound lytic murein transglycosylase A